MGFFNRLKLNSLSISSDSDLHPCRADGTREDMIRILITNLGGLTLSEEGIVIISPKKTIKIHDRLDLYSDAEIREKFSKQLSSLAQADAYMIDDEIKEKEMGYATKWGRTETEKVLIKYESWVLYWPPTGFIVRTGSTSWIAYEIPTWAVCMNC